MSSNKSSTAPGRPGKSLAIRRRRTIMACSNCRRRKIRCLTSEQPPTNPCTYCVRKRLTCEYVAVADPDGYSPTSPDAPVEDHAESEGTSSPSPPAPTLWTPPVTSAHFSRTPPILSPEPRLPRNFTPSLLRSNEPSPVNPSSPLPPRRRSMDSMDRAPMCVLPVYPMCGQHSASSWENHAYDLQAMHAFQYLSNRTNGLHLSTLLSTSPSPASEYFADYTQIPAFNYLDSPGYGWPPPPEDFPPG